MKDIATIKEEIQIAKSRFEYATNKKKKRKVAILTKKLGKLEHQLATEEKKLHAGWALCSRCNRYFCLEHLGLKSGAWLCLKCYGDAKSWQKSKKLNEIKAVDE